MMRILFLLFLAVLISGAGQLHAQALPEAESPSANSTEDANGGVAAPKEEEKSTGTAAWQGSLLFDSDTALRLREAVESYRQGNGAGDYLSDITAPTEQQLEKRSPHFYLGSIIYPSSGEWFLWLNGKKITALKPPENMQLTVETITPHSATFAWKPESFMEEVRTSWKRRQEINAYLGQATSNVQFDEKSETVTFTLSPNQTFFSQSMQVAEGHLPPGNQLPKGFRSDSAPDDAALSLPSDSLPLSAVPSAPLPNASQNSATSPVLKTLPSTVPKQPSAVSAIVPIPPSSPAQPRP